MSTRTAIVAEARSRLGERYLHQASIKGVACDCIGLVAGVAIELGMPSGIAWANDPEMHNYATAPNKEKLLAAVAKYLNPIADPRQVKPGDILLLRWEDDPAHFAIVSSLFPLRIIHAYASVHKVVENNIEDRWRNHKRWDEMIDSAWSYKEVED